MGMTEKTIWSQYEERLLRVMDYIHDHLDEDLDLERLGEIACLSSYHWHRIYRAVQGETAAQTIRRARLQRAATELINSDMPISIIARRAAYPNLQSFTRNFTSAFQVSPGAYRRQKLRLYANPALEKETVMYDVKMRNIAPLTLVGIPHQGSYMEIGKSFDKLFALAVSRNIAPVDARSIAIYYDDPDVVAEDSLRSVAALVPTQAIAAEAPLTSVSIAGGDYAILRHRGAYGELHQAYRWFYGEWMAVSGHALRDAPCFEDYLNDPKDTPPSELLTDIYVPLQ